MRPDARPSDRNPCTKCTEKPENRGCGRQAKCEKYLAYFQRNRERGDEKVRKRLLNEYTSDSVYQAKNGGAHNLGKKYRPRGRW